MRKFGFAPLALWLLLACGPEAESPRGREPVSIRLEDESLSVIEEASVRIGARALDRHGTVIPGAELRYESADPSVASVDSHGWVRGERRGATEITVRAGSAEAVVTVEVRPRVVEVLITPAEPHLLEDDELRLEYILLDRQGEPFQAELEARWRSEAAEIARVSADGLLKAMAPGSARIQVAVGEGEGETTVFVAPRAHRIELHGGPEVLVAGEEMGLEARVFDRRDQLLERELSWSSSDPAVATVNEGGRVHAVGPGEALIRAEAEGAMGEFALQVLPAVAELEIETALRRIYAGGVTTWTAHALDEEGKRLEGRTILWFSDEPEVASVVSHTGRIEGLSEGIATITARAGEVEASATVEVLPAASIRVTSPPPSRLEPGFSAPLAAEIDGEVILPLAWNSNDPGVARVEEGEVEVVALGRATLAVESGGLRLEYPIAGSLRFQSVAAGDDFACGLSDQARVWCWGANRFGQLGNGGEEASHIPVRVALDPLLRFADITAGSQHACALSEDDRAFCWGSNRSGELGAETEEEFSSIPLASVPEERFASLSAGALPSIGPLPKEGAHTCGLTLEGRALCWGNGRVGQMGDGSTSEVSPPVEPHGGHLFVELRASAGYSCGRTEDGEIYCWGQGPLGTPLEIFQPIQESSTPRIALYEPEGFPSVPEAFDSFSLGWRHVCGITPQAEVYCWGASPGTALGTSGYNVFMEVVFFNPISGGSTPDAWQLLALGSTSSCGLDPWGGLHCWGRSFGELESCSKPNSLYPGPISIAERVAEVAIGRRYCEDFACALDVEGLVRCWGSNDEGQTGQPPSLRVPSPTPLYPDREAP